MSLRALLLDLDGTIADTEETHRQAFNDAFRLMELPWEWSPHRYAAMLAISGGKLRLHAFIDTLEVGAAEAKRLHGLVPLVHETKTRIYRELIEQAGARLRPGVARLLREARAAGLRVGVVSTTSSSSANALLRGQLGIDGLGCVDALAAAEMVKRPKPAPDLYLHALALLRESAEHALAIEDSENGVRAARRAGIVTLAMPGRWTARQDFSEADYRLSSLGTPEAPLPEDEARLAGAPVVGVAELRALHAAAAQRGRSAGQA